MASSASALPWLWVIEALASSKQVDTSIIKELVERTPEITGDMGKNAREMVYFRVLDTLALQQVRSNGSGSSASVSENKIDPSESCENVIVRMLHKRTDKAEMLKSEEVQNFITQKRASLPKCTLQKLKDAILEGKHPALASFKEKSGLSTSKKARVETSTNDVTIEAIGLSDVQTVERGDLTSPNVENDDNSQKDRGNGNLTPAKRVTGYLESENQNQAFRSHTEYPSLDHGSDTHLHISKKPKHSAPVTGLVVGNEPLSAERDEQREALVHELELDLPGKEARDEIRTAKAASLNRPRENICSEPNPRSEKIQGREFNTVQECSSEQREALVDELELDLPVKEAGDETRTSKAASPNRARENICSEPNPNCEKFQGRESNTGKECSSDSDGYHEENLDISTKRCDFLSSNFTLTQDSLAAADCTELSLCTKCDKGGDLLVCSGAVCPMVVHQGCLGAAPSFDSSGKFLCPFCSYSHAISEYLETKKKASMARKDLKVFIGSESGTRPKKRPKNSIRPEHSQPRQDDNASKNYQEHQNLGNMQQAEASSNGNTLLNVEGALGNDGTVLASKEGNRERGKTDPQNQLVMDLEREKIEDGHRPKQIAKKSITTGQNQQRKDKIVNQNNQKPQNHNKENISVMQQSKVALVDDAVTFASKESKREGGKVGPEYQPAMASEEKQIEAGDSHNQRNNREKEIVVKTKKHKTVQVDRDSNADVAASGEGKDGLTASDYIMRPRKEELRYTYPVIAQISRIRVPWTSEEEEVLEEGVHKFSGTLDRATRWKQILEFGNRVFHENRTGGDLKDKWRNICKRRANL